jgi:hypothetical protein
MIHAVALGVAIACIVVGAIAAIATALGGGWVVARAVDWCRRLVGLRGWRSAVHATPLKALIACESCEEREATVRVPSELEERDVWFCEWCYRRWRKANRTMAIPKTRKPTRNGGPGGRAA